MRLVGQMAVVRCEAFWLSLFFFFIHLFSRTRIFSLSLSPSASKLRCVCVGSCHHLLNIYLCCHRHGRPRVYLGFHKINSSQMCVCLYIFSHIRCPFSEIPSIRFELSTLTVVFSYTYIWHFPFSHEMTLPSYASHHINHFVFVVCA